MQPSDLKDDDVVEISPGVWMTLEEARKIAKSAPPDSDTLYGFPVLIEKQSKLPKGVRDAKS